MGSNLIAKDLVASCDFEAISKNTAEVIQWIKEVTK
jgi:predicted small metal-binding protein